MDHILNVVMRVPVLVEVQMFYNCGLDECTVLHLKNSWIHRICSYVPIPDWRIARKARVFALQVPFPFQQTCWHRPQRFHGWSSCSGQQIHSELGELGRLSRLITDSESPDGRIRDKSDKWQELQHRCPSLYVTSTARSDILLQVLDSQKQNCR